MELRDIEYFLAVCRTMKLKRAAEQCGVAQPTLTRAIQKLERELGGLLVARERNLTHLTPLGRLVQPQLEELATPSRNLRRQAQQHARLDCADLRLGVMCSVGPQRFGPFFGRFRDDNPGIEIMLADATPERLAERLLQGEFDAAVTVVPAGFGERLQVEPLYAERFVVACGPDHPFELRNTISMRDMDGQSYLMRINCEHTEVLEEALREAGAKLVLAARSEREDWIQALTAAGMGVCFLPEFSATMAGVIACRVEDSPVARQVCLLTVAGRRWSAAMARFVEALRRARWDG
ncbi:MAG TPA: LysR family transcriptional regulator [Falsiroseomonas sp.]|jgi:DNA-binding transcriptional LysR family regulator|nr:LysR family transcriptional regulator [Falsiroseomonas sp.]